MVFAKTFFAGAFLGFFKDGATSVGTRGSRIQSVMIMPTRFSYQKQKFSENFS